MSETLWRITITAESLTLQSLLDWCSRSGGGARVNYAPRQAQLLDKLIEGRLRSLRGMVHEIINNIQTQFGPGLLKKRRWFYTSTTVDCLWKLLLRSIKFTYPTEYQVVYWIEDLLPLVACVFPFVRWDAHYLIKNVKDKWWKHALLKVLF